MNHKPRPSLKLNLSVRFHVEEWLSSSITNLITCDAADFIAEDYHYLSPEVIQLIWQTRSQVQRHRQALACQSYRVRHDTIQCPTYSHLACESSWDTAWKAVMLFTLRPTNPDNGQRTLERLRSVSIPATKPGCRSNTMLDVQADGCLTRDEFIIAEGISAVIQAVRSNGITVPVE